MKILFLGGIDIGLLNKMVSGQLPPPPRKIAPRLGSGSGLGLFLGLEGNLPQWQLS